MLVLLQEVTFILNRKSTETVATTNQSCCLWRKWSFTLTPQKELTAPSDLLVAFRGATSKGGDG